MNTHTFYSKDLFDVCVSCDVLHCVCFIQVLCFFDNFFALLHVLTNQSRYKYVSLYWVHSASYLTLMNKVLLEEVDSRSYPYPHKKSHNTGADIQIDFSSHNYSPILFCFGIPPPPFLLLEFFYQNFCGRSTNEGHRFLNSTFCVTVLFD